MSEQIKTGLKSAAEIIQTFALAGITVAIGFMLNTLVAHSNSLAVHTSQIAADNARLDRLETKGSASLVAHESQDDQRIAGINGRLDKLETAVIALQTAPGELKAINARLDGIKESLARFEKSLDDHMKGKP